MAFLIIIKLKKIDYYKSPFFLSDKLLEKRQHKDNLSYLIKKIRFRYLQIWCPSVCPVDAKILW